MSTPPRGKLAIIQELRELTQQMADKLGDADFLILSVDKRQDLMDEFDMVDLQHTDDPTPEQQADIKRMIQEIIKLDQGISAALEKHKAESKSDLAKSNSQQKILGYMNQAMSSSGSYMDYKK